MALVKRDEIVAVGDAPVSMLSHQAVLRRITGLNEVLLSVVRFPVRHPRRSYSLLTKTSLQNPDPSARPATVHHGIRNETALTLPGAAFSHGANGATMTTTATATGLPPLDESIIRREVEAPLGYGAYTPHPTNRPRSAPSHGYVDSSMRGGDTEVRAGWSPANVDVRGKISPTRVLSVRAISEGREDGDEIEPPAGEPLLPRICPVYVCPYACSLVLLQF